METRKLGASGFTVPALTFGTGTFGGRNEFFKAWGDLVNAVDASLRRLGTDVIDLYQLHVFDALTPVEEAVDVLDDLVRAGKIRYVGCSNFSGWYLMKSLAVSERHGLARYVAHPVYYSLVGRDYEWELMPLALEANVGAMIWSPLGWGRLTGNLRQNLGAVGWKLSAAQIAKLDAASTVPLPYPYWHQRGTNSDRNPPPV